MNRNLHNHSDRPYDAGSLGFSYRLEKASPEILSFNGDEPRLHLPTGFPDQVYTASTWTGAELTLRETEWILRLTPEEAEVVVQSVFKFKDSGQALQEISTTTFVLPADLSCKLHDISEKCYNGLGFCILRGIEHHQLSEEDRTVLFAGVSAHVASRRGFQDIERTNVLAHLFKKHRKTPDDYIPPSFDDDELSFHTDDGDIVALFYANQQSQGGRTLLASGNKVYNEIAAARPDILTTLAQDWAIDRYYGPRDGPARRLPLLHRHGANGITLQFTRLPFSCYVGSRERKADIPALTAAQIEALNALQSLSAKHQFAVPTSSHDILYFNNVDLFHGREPYTESTAEGSLPRAMDRLVLRLWLQDPDKTTVLAEPLQKIWDEIYGPNTASGRKEVWNTKPTAAYALNADKNG